MCVCVCQALVSESSRWSRDISIQFLEEIEVSDLQQFIPSLLQFGHWEVLTLLQ